MNRELALIDLETVRGGVQQLVNTGSPDAPVYQWVEQGEPAAKSPKPHHAKVRAPVPAARIPAIGPKRGWLGLLQGLRAFL